VPEISVIIPTFNRAGLIGRCLDALARQTAAPESFEVVVVDDGSTDATADLLARRSAPHALRVERQSNSGQSAARNRGISCARGRYCLFLDDDIEAGEGLVEEHLAAQRALGGAIGIGNLGISLRERPGAAENHFATWWKSHYERLADGSRQPDFRECYSGNLSAPLDVVREVGGFDPSLPASMDVEFAYRLQQTGLRAVFLPRASAEQIYVKSFPGIVRDWDAMGVAAVKAYRRHPELLQYPPLGDFNEGGPRMILARRALLASRAPTWPLRLFDRVLAGRPPARVYTVLQQHCFWRSVRRELGNSDDWSALTRGPVVLLYHALGGRQERASRYIVPAARFRRQLRWLRRRGYKVISLDDYAACRHDGRIPPSKSVVITFDDGYADNLDRGLPLLQEAGFGAHLFVVAGAVGSVTRWPPSSPLDGRQLLTWEQVDELGRTGVEIGAHTMSHPKLRDLQPDEARWEIEESRSMLERRLEAPVSHFAYPYGNTSAEVQELVREAGFETACGIQEGPNGHAVPIHELRRVEVRGTWSLLTFALAVRLGFEPRLRRR